MKGKNTLITGGAGFIGSNLVEKLASDNVILVMDNLHTGLVSNLDEFMFYPAWIEHELIANRSVSKRYSLHNNNMLKT